MSDLGSARNPLKVAIVGAGPSGFYAAEALFKSQYQIHIDMFDRLPAPYGLVRNGVAPDHPKLKQVIQVYDKIAQSNSGYSYLGNVMIGRDVLLSELRETHHVVIFTSGAETDRKLGISGENIKGSHTATEFVGWYNGHPDYRDREFDLSQEVAVIIGQGNVAADVARILSKSVDELKTTDIAQYALDVLAESKIKEIHVIGRRGPAQAKFTNKELREFGELTHCDAIIDSLDLEINETSAMELECRDCSINKKNMDIFRGFSEFRETGKPRRCHFRFLMSPVELQGRQRLEKVILQKNQLAGDAFSQSSQGTGERVELNCGILFRSIGYRGLPINALPFDDHKGVIPNQAGRILDDRDTVIPGLYTAGWIKRGPTGIIGTNRACSVETVQSILEDIPNLNATPKPGANGLFGILQKRNARVVNYSDWRRIDAEEIRYGEAKGKPREKFTRLDEMLAALD